jgi:hypothetical protein
VGGLDRCRPPAGSDLAGHAPLGQHLPAGLVVVAGVQVHHRLGGQPPDHAAGGCKGVQGRPKQPVVAAVGRCGDRAQRDAARVGDDRAFQALLAAVDRARPGDLAAAGRLDDAPVDGQVLQLKAEQPLVGGKHRQAQLFGHPGVDPLVAAAAQGGGRAGVIGDAAVAAAEHQDLDELVEHQPVGDAPAVAAQRVVDGADRQQGGDLDPQRFQDRRWQGRHETSG